MQERISRHAVIHYGEISLKGRNRPFFERALSHAIAQRLEDLGLQQVERLSGRMIVHLEQPLGATTWAERLGTVFGIANFSLAYLADPDMDALRAAILELLPANPPASFRVRASRDDKTFPLTSPEIERDLGAAVYEHTQWPVQLKDAALVIQVEVLRHHAILSFEKIEGPGGLPVGASGRVGLLLSGGIDSPVAGLMLLKRGCHVIPIHFHSRPFGNWMGSEARSREIVRTLLPYGIEPFFYTVPIGRQQREITVQIPDTYRVILYRRLMVRIAERLTRREKGKALVTGESLGQVASQTLEGIAAVEQAASMPILRPLVGMDKKEIVAIAERIGTYPLSLMEGDDCCQFLMPRSVVTRPRLEQVLDIEARTEMDRLVEEALEQAKKQRV
ncbi:MAG: tRNA 4-thiouridine(8) synthase ThiI [Anaerolineae bacterium]|nr:tRNA 4-thiouridine(8) synthase ThiI [Anaerolineae bacterium]